ncbi:ribokinase [Herbiconiux moechotypicola]|uniref:Ribokinase n=1 Tax=Herbiconiux moechotypicola TaxID=637393 RepID=A0ABN3E6J4_9MICO|nr:ribokinase [Herbiconiux moechotypicola]MCS5731999.1 ribokinase [Herbiconiux moechotypicola]
MRGSDSESTQGCVIVVGSINHDTSFTVTELPAPGQTVVSSEVSISTGGKGANQAISAARLGARTAFIGSVGRDLAGREALAVLDAEGVDTVDVELIAGSQTGRATVAVAATGEKVVFVAPGANAQVNGRRVVHTLSRRASVSDVVVLQGECGAAVIDQVARHAVHAGIRLVLNLAPFVPLLPEVVASADPLIVNEREAAELLGHLGSSVDDLDSLTRLARSVVVIHGARGAWYAGPDGAAAVPAPPAMAIVDSTGAGDALVGALASALSMGRSLPDAVTLGVAAGAFAASRRGTHASYPFRNDVRLGANN